MSVKFSVGVVGTGSFLWGREMGFHASRSWGVSGKAEDSDGSQLLSMARKRRKEIRAVTGHGRG